MNNLDKFVVIASLLASFLGAIAAGWSIMRTRKKFYAEFISRRERRDP